jgi:hypothetical protein
LNPPVCLVPWRAAQHSRRDRIPKVATWSIIPSNTRRRWCAEDARASEGGARSPQRAASRSIGGAIALLAPVVMLVTLILYPVAYSFWVSLHHKHAYLPIQTRAGLPTSNFPSEDPSSRSLKLGRDLCVWFQ